MDHLLHMLLLSLAVTILVEGVLALLVPFMRRHLKEVVLVNLLTNPPYVLAILFLRILVPPAVLILLQVILEILIFYIEGSLYGYIIKRSGEPPAHPFLFSLAANLLSIAAGILLSR